MKGNREMAIYDAKGKQISSKKIKQTIMKAHGWTSTEYRKKYDIFKNKLRAYEEYKRVSGHAVKVQSPVEVLYKQAKSIMKAQKIAIQEGRDPTKAYKPSVQMQQIMGFTSVSMGKAGKKLAQSKKYQAKVNLRMSAYVANRFAGMIDAYGLQDYIDQIQDPFKLEKALTEYANKLHAMGTRDKAKGDGEAIPLGETEGSDPEVDFDFSMYYD